MNKLTSERIKAWEYLLDLNPDLALLQEINSIPDFIKNDFDCLYRKATNNNGQPQKFGTAILVKGKIFDSIQLTSESSWVDEKLNLFNGNFVAVKAILENGFRANVISVHSPAWNIDKVGLEEIEYRKLKLENNKNISGAELLWAALTYLISKSSLPWIVGGDFNSSPTFDLPKNRGNQEILDRMNFLDLKECLFHSKGILTPTFKNATDKKIIHQIDHLFVSKEMIADLELSITGDTEKVFGNRLSDHLPIITEFSI